MSLLSFVYSQLFVEPPIPDHDFSGQTFVITGGNTGLGLEAARHLIRLKASRIILGVRSMEKGAEAIKLLRGGMGDTSDACSLDMFELDMEKYSSVQIFAKSVATLGRVDGVLLNAGKVTQDFYLAEGNESTLTVNVTATFLLAILLLPILRQTAIETGSSPRLSIVTSDRHVESNLPEWKESNTFAALNDPNRAIMDKRYHVSKLLQILMARNLAQLLGDVQERANQIIVNMLTPGMCKSGLTKDLRGLFGAQIAVMDYLLARSTEVGARTLIAALAQGAESHGKYMNDGRVQESALSSFVRSEAGTLAAAKVWEELMSQLEHVQPDIRAIVCQKD
ncbi:unnamed protein product [Clonostachys rosea]|uniref:Uncharacterized protein n=1 Tax=Bionectria ochroleuca TaxID=29856 RepID=A0ABY6V0F1_BIOOC|nr:unnamed protein product [Clonostachys rosea]